MGPIEVQHLPGVGVWAADFSCCRSETQSHSSESTQFPEGDAVSLWSETNRVGQARLTLSSQTKTVTN